MEVIAANSILFFCNYGLRYFLAVFPSVPTLIAAYSNVFFVCIIFISLPSCGFVSIHIPPHINRDGHINPGFPEIQIFT